MSIYLGNSGTGTEVGPRFSMTMVGWRAILATEVRRESRKVVPAERGVSPTALCGRSAEVSGDDLPVVEVSAGSGQVQHDAPH